MFLSSNKIIKSIIKIKAQNFDNKNKKTKNKTEARSTKNKLLYSFIFSVHQSHVSSIKHETLFVYR